MIRPSLQNRGPGVLTYLILLCIRPEQWPQAARYKLRFTFVALCMATLVVSVGVGMRAASTVVPAARAFAQSYDHDHPEMKYAQGKLSPASDAQTLPPGKFWPKFLLGGLPMVIDPTGKTAAQGMGGERNIVINQTALTVPGNFEGYDLVIPLSTLERDARMLGWNSGELRINSASLGHGVDLYGPALAVGFGIGTAFSEVIATILWAGLTAFLVLPVVQLVAYRLTMPRRIAFRVALAVTIPLVVLDGALKIAGFSTAEVLTGDWVLVFWFACAAAMAGWAGWMANAEFAHKGRGAGV